MCKFYIDKIFFPNYIYNYKGCYIKSSGIEGFLYYMSVGLCNILKLFHVI